MIKIPTSKNINNFVLNGVESKEVFEEMKRQGLVEADQLYLIYGNRDSDDVVYSVNGKTGDVELDAEDVGALPDDTVIPTALADLTADSTHRVVTDAEKTTWNGKQSAISDLATIRSGAALGATALQSYTETDPVFTASPAHGISLSDISNWNSKGTYSKPSGGIPKTDLASAVQTSLGRADSALQEHQDISGKLNTDGNGSNVTATFTQASTRANIATGEKLSVIFGKIAKWFADLKTVAFTGSYNDLSNKPTIPTTLSQLTDDSTHRLVTDTEKSTWNGKGTYSKPSGGIPAADIAAGAVSTIYTATIPHASSSWIPIPVGVYFTEITVNGLLTTDTPVIDVAPDTESADVLQAIEDWGMCLLAGVTSADTLSLAFSDIPSVDIPIKILCVRK